MSLSLSCCVGCFRERSTLGPSSTVRVSMVRVPVGAQELQDVTVKGEAFGQGMALSDAMADVLEQAAAKGGNFVFVDNVSTSFEERHSERTYGTSSREVAVTQVHARVFLAPVQPR
jgi:hypothetical protein